LDTNAECREIRSQPLERGDQSQADGFSLHRLSLRYKLTR
jgi:hypothetical protein